MDMGTSKNLVSFCRRTEESFGIFSRKYCDAYKWFAFCVCLVFLALVFVWSPSIKRLNTVPKEVVEDTRAYLRRTPGRPVPTEVADDTGGYDIHTPGGSVLTDVADDNRGYRIHTQGCSAPEMNPFDETVLSFIKHVPDMHCGPTWPSVTYQDGLWMRINRSQFVFEGSSGFSHCEFSVISRIADDDWKYSTSKPVKFDQDIMVSSEFITVTCYDVKHRAMYRNYHAFVLPDTHMKKKTFKLRTQQAEKPNVLFLGVDAVSQLNMMRHLNRTRHFLVNELNSIEFYGYNKVAENTFLNMLALLTGKFLRELPLTETEMMKKHIDDIGFIWRNFSEAGYVTLLAEDQAAGSNFNYLKAGFRNQPTDYYLRPFSLALDKYPNLWHQRYCFVDRLETQIVIDWLSDFLDANKNNTFFAFTFLTKMSHDFLNHVGGADYIYLRLFQSLQSKGHLRNTIVVFFSDHGLRVGGIRKTHIGKMEERLPMMTIYLPPRFKQKYPRATKNLQLNARRLTTPFDIYSTLRDILNMNFEGKTDSNRTSRGISLFTEVPANRTCEQAEISPHWCTCQSHEEIDIKDYPVWKAANFATACINQMTMNKSDCVVLHLKTVVRAWRLVKNRSVLKHHLNYNDYQIMFSAVPGGGEFEATVRHFVSNDTFALTGDADEIGRINMYNEQSYCVKERVLKKYCYCSKQI